MGFSRWSSRTALHTRLPVMAFTIKLLDARDKHFGKNTWRITGRSPPILFLEQQKHSNHTFIKYTSLVIYAYFTGRNASPVFNGQLVCFILKDITKYLQLYYIIIVINGLSCDGFLWIFYLLFSFILGGKSCKFKEKSSFSSCVVMSDWL